MIDTLSNKVVQDKCTTNLEFYNNLKRENINEFILYGDNILEGVSVLNNLADFVNSNDLEFKLVQVIFSPIDEPVYLFGNGENFFSIKISGSFDRWETPSVIDNIKNFVDLPDYLIYSLKSKKAIIVGENTDTASVGNSQWQREGRKIGAAKQRVPFVYQTFYSGKDESQNTIREPTSLQVYNQLLYTAKYRVPSLVIYISSDFKDGDNHDNSKEGLKLLSKYIYSLILSDFDDSYKKMTDNVEKDILSHMISYITENKKKHSIVKPRIEHDHPVINEKILNDFINKPDIFIENLLSHCKRENEDTKKYLSKLFEYNYSKEVPWKSYDNKNFINTMISFVRSSGGNIYSYSTKSKVAWTKDIRLVKSFLKKLGLSKKTIDTLNEESDRLIIIPLRLHKKSNNKLTWSPDPESGEIVAFSELFGFEISGIKIRNILGYVIVDPGQDFNIYNKSGKLYNSLAEYLDLIVINNNKLISNLNKFSNIKKSFNNPINIFDYKPIRHNEESAVASVLFSGTTIRKNWKLNFIHTHHSSWQQLAIYFNDCTKRYKNDRISTKLDLIMQNNNIKENSDIFLLSEGKYSFKDFFKKDEPKKISDAFEITRNLISSEKSNENESSEFIDSFLCFVENINHSESFFNELELKNIEEVVKHEKFSEITQNPYVVIAVYSEQNKTKFRVYYSKYSNSYIESIVKSLI